MVYRAFSEPKNIERMVRTLKVFFSQQSVETAVLNWRSAPYPNLGHWVKYVSAGPEHQREAFMYFDTRTEERFRYPIGERIDRDRRYFAWLEKYFLQSYRDFRRLSDQYYVREPAWFSALPRERLVHDLRHFYAVSKRATMGYYVVYDLVSLLSARVERALDRCGQSRFFRHLAQLGMHSIIHHERLAFLRRLRLIQQQRRSQRWSSRLTQQLIFRQWYEYGSCVFAHQTGQKYSLDEYWKKFRRCQRLDPEAERRRLRRLARMENRKLRKLITLISPDRQLRRDIERLRRMLAYRNGRALQIESYFDHAAGIFAAVAQLLGVAAANLCFLSRSEMIAGLRNRTNADRLINYRKRQGVTIKQVGPRVVFLTGISRSDRHHLTVSPSPLRGRSAFPGTRSGLVRVVFNPAHAAANFHPGHILVTSMTTPEFVPLMKRAAAVITDEGGILSHAAIVARELRVPCIIGTGQATKVLKDGDRVEVNADLGTVKKL